MLELHFDLDDLLHVEFAPHPAPLMELGLAVATLQRHDDTASFGAWRRERRRCLPRAALPLFGLVPPTGAGPLFLDPPLASATAGIDAVMSTGYAAASRELQRVFSAGRPPGPWVRALAAADRGAWSDLHLALRTGLDVLVDPDWERLRRAYAHDIAWRTHLQSTRGLGATLVSLFPGSKWADGCLRVPLGHHAVIRLGGRGLTLMPSTVWTGGPLVGSDSRGRPLLIYPAMTALPHAAVDDPDDLGALLGRTRAHLMRCLGEAPATTSTLAHTLAVSPASVSQHTTTLRRARLITSVREGKQVWHAPTELGSQLLGAPPGTPDAFSPAPVQDRSAVTRTARSHNRSR